MAKYISRDGGFLGIHAEKNQDIEVENDEAHVLGQQANPAGWAGVRAEANLTAGRYGDGKLAGYRDTDGDADGSFVGHSQADSPLGFDIDVAPNGDLHMAARAAVYQHNQTDLEFVQGAGDDDGPSALAAWDDPDIAHISSAVDVVDYISSSVRTAAGDDDGPRTLAVWDDTDVSGISSQQQIAGELFQFRKVSGDWDGDGDTVGLLGDADADGDMDGADFV